MITLGVEVEFQVVDNPSPDYEYESPYMIFSSSNKATPVGTRHSKHGNLAKLVEAVTGDRVKVGYDGTATDTRDERDGFELKGTPGTLEENREMWKEVYGSWGKKHLAATDHCGMHVHVSVEDIDSELLKRLQGFVCNPANADFIRYVAGRYDGDYCRIRTYADIEVLFHANNCRKTKRRGAKIDVGEVPGYDLEEEWVDLDEDIGRFCCRNMRSFREHVSHGTYRRSALNLVPSPGTGHLEFRLFESPQTIERCMASMEFVDSLIHFCKKFPASDHAIYRAWLEEDRQRRSDYRHLFRWLRDGGYVEGLIPRVNG